MNPNGYNCVDTNVAVGSVVTVGYSRTNSLLPEQYARSFNLRFVKAPTSKDDTYQGTYDVDIPDPDNENVLVNFKGTIKGGVPK